MKKIKNKIIQSIIINKEKDTKDKKDIPIKAHLPKIYKFNRIRKFNSEKKSIKNVHKD